MSSNTYGRQVVLPLTNKSGGSVAAGDVVIVDTTNNDAFTTNTAAGFTGLVGIATATIANNAVGVVLIEGYASLVNVNASVTRGNYGKTFTVAKQASDAGAARGVGTFCQFLTGGTTPDAVLFNPDLLGTSLTNPMTTANDLIIGGASGVPARLATSASKTLQTDGSGVIAWTTPTSAAAYGQAVPYPTTFTGDSDDGSSLTPWVDVSAFDVAEVLNSTVIHLVTKGASKDQSKRKTLGTPMAGAFDFRIALSGDLTYWSSEGDSYIEFRFTTSVPATIAMFRLVPRTRAVTATPCQFQTGTSSIGSGAFGANPVAPMGTPLLVRVTRDGSDKLRFYIGFGQAPMALTTVYDTSNNQPYNPTSAGTIARAEIAIHTPSGPGSGAEFGVNMDYFQSV